MYYANGDKYDGNWKNDLKDGDGTYWGANGNIYEGQWKDDKYNGKGRNCSKDI